MLRRLFPEQVEGQRVVRIDRAALDQVRDGLIHCLPVGRQPSRLMNYMEGHHASPKPSSDSSSFRSGVEITFNSDFIVEKLVHGQLIGDRSSTFSLSYNMGNRHLPM